MRTWTQGTMLALAVAATVMAGCSKKQTAQPPDMNPNGGGTTNNGDIKTPGETTPPGTDSTSGRLEDVFFDYDQFTLRDDSRRVLDSNANALKTNADWSVTLEGHCDERGTVEYNLALGEKRARATKDYLVRMGVGDTRLNTLSYGEERPFDPGHDESSYSLNRRVHFKR